MARAVRNPRLAAPVGERHGDEASTKVVHPKRDALGRRVVQLGALNAGFLEPRAQLLGHVQRVCWRLKNELVLLALEVRKRGRNTGGQRPGSRVIRLVAVEAHGSALEIEIRPAQTERFGDAAALAGEEAVEQPLADRDRLAREQRPILVGVDVRHGSAPADLRHEPLRYRVRVAELQRVHREVEQAVQDERDMAPRAGAQLPRLFSFGLRGRALDRCHDALDVGERESADTHVSDLWVHVLVPFVQARLMSGTEDYWELTVLRAGHPFYSVEGIPDLALRRVVPVMAQAMAIAAGYTSFGGGSVLDNPFHTRIIGIGHVEEGDFFVTVPDPGI